MKMPIMWNPRLSSTMPTLKTKYVSHWESEYLRSGKEYTETGSEDALRAMAYFAHKQAEHMRGTRIERKWKAIEQWLRIKQRSTR
jgi:hypothetical protein